MLCKSVCRLFMPRPGRRRRRRPVLACQPSKIPFHIYIPTLTIYQQYYFCNQRSRPSEAKTYLGRVLPTAFLASPRLVFPSSFITAFAFRSWGRFFGPLLATRYLFGTQLGMLSPLGLCCCRTWRGERGSSVVHVRGFLPFLGARRGS